MSELQFDVIKSAFAERYFAWASREIRAEVESKFPRLTMLRGGVAMAVLETIRSWPEAEQEAFLLAKLKRIHNHATGCSLPLDAKEAALLGRLNGAPWRDSAADREIMRRIQEMDFVRNFAPTRRAIKAKLAPLLGKPMPVRANTWRHRTEVEGFTLCTEVMTHRAGVDYEHTIQLGERMVLRWISLLGWLGIGGSTKWQFVTEEEAAEIPETIRAWSAYFLGELPGLVSGLAPVGGT